MTKEDIIYMAKEAGAIPIHGDYKELALVRNDVIERFAALVVAAERERGQKWFDAVTAQHKQEILAEREAMANQAIFNNDFKNRLATAIEAMPFGDTAASFAVYIREFK